VVEDSRPGGLDVERFDRGSAGDAATFRWIPGDGLPDSPPVTVRRQRERDVRRLVADNVGRLRAITSCVHVRLVRLSVDVRRNSTRLTEFDPGVFCEPGPRSHAGPDQYHLYGNAVLGRDDGLDPAAAGGFRDFRVQVHRDVLFTKVGGS
jgi:hypothetical protein